MGLRPLGEADGGYSNGQWLVRNFLIHDKVSGMLALERKEELQIALMRGSKKWVWIWWAGG